MKKVILSIVLVLSIGSVVCAEAPTPDNANSQWVTICSWDTNPACLVYHLVSGVLKLWH